MQMHIPMFSCICTCICFNYFLIDAISSPQITVVVHRTLPSSAQARAFCAAVDRRRKQRRLMEQGQLRGCSGDSPVHVFNVISKQVISEGQCEVDRVNQQAQHKHALLEQLSDSGQQYNAPLLANHGPPSPSTSLQDRLVGTVDQEGLTSAGGPQVQSENGSTDGDSVSRASVASALSHEVSGAMHPPVEHPVHFSGTTTTDRPWPSSTAPHLASPSITPALSHPLMSPTTPGALLVLTPTPYNTAIAASASSALQTTMYASPSTFPSSSPISSPLHEDFALNMHGKSDIAPVIAPPLQPDTSCTHLPSMPGEDPITNLASSALLSTTISATPFQKDWVRDDQRDGCDGPSPTAISRSYIPLPPLPPVSCTVAVRGVTANLTDTQGTQISAFMEPDEDSPPGLHLTVEVSLSIHLFLRIVKCCLNTRSLPNHLPSYLQTVSRVCVCVCVCVCVIVCVFICICLTVSLLNCPSLLLTSILMLSTASRFHSVIYFC